MWHKSRDPTELLLSSNLSISDAIYSKIKHHHHHHIHHPNAKVCNHWKCTLCFTLPSKLPSSCTITIVACHHQQHVPSPSSCAITSGVRRREKRFVEARRGTSQRRITNAWRTNLAESFFEARLTRVVSLTCPRRKTGGNARKRSSPIGTQKMDFLRLFFIYSSLFLFCA